MDFQKDLDAAKSLVAEKEKNLKNAKKGSEKETARQELEDAKGKLKYAEEILNEARSQEAKANAEASARRQDKISAKITDAKALELPVREKIGELRHKISNKEKAIANANKEYDTLRSKLGTSTHTQADVQRVRSEIEKAKLKIDRLKKQKTRLEKEIGQSGEELFKLQKETQKHENALAAEQRAALGITSELYEYLRSRSPNGDIKSVIQNQKVDAVYGKDIVGTPHADHIVSMNEITQMEGFNRLTLNEQLEVLNLPENFMALDGRVNSSKGDRSFSKWEGHPEFGEIPPENRKKLLEREAKAREDLIKAIR